MPPVRKSYRAKTPLLTSLARDQEIRRKEKYSPYKAALKDGQSDTDTDSGDEALVARDEKFAASVKKLIQEDAEARVYEEAEVAETEAGDDVGMDDDDGDNMTLFQDAPPMFESSCPQYKTIGDILFEQMEAQKRREAEKQRMELFTETTRTAYQNLGKFMSRYRSGKLPQLLKCIPRLKNWADILWLTHPENWTCHAIKEATPVFVNGLRNRDVSRYLQYVVLPAVLKSIDTHQKLNLHLFEALKKAIYKAQEWIKGIYFPIILDDACNYKRATIINAVLAKCSITPITAGALLVKLATLPSHNHVIIYSMIRIINKKHNLPLNVLNCMVSFFERYLEIDEPQNVIWHQLLLVFAQRWKDDLTPQQKEKLKLVMRKHTHPHITPEIRRELFASGPADVSMV
eukprot:Blabericola_migrator_1__2336@NODE_1651_length_4092_cov_128_792298_g1074_i0_p2_GENE_NODE_1651_length_4092_cov_128_792298_g1074_i0NODE_1651_length_4092_cov_128_792298_g1074_i0_p2_ORF_typecomplete_len402_score79_44Bystin/PF05291_11/1_5e84TFIIF_alpha/PF05793_12/1_7DUF3280/PF11684_8/34DUF3280/PF11684_8/25_NODE_1651_length_4092_cov_128_792298_g1074_i03181523